MTENNDNETDRYGTYLVKRLPNGLIQPVGSEEDLPDGAGDQENAVWLDLDSINDWFRNRHADMTETNENEIDTDDTYRTECPRCEKDAIFTPESRFGNLSCDSCGYIPRRKTRYEIRGEETP